MSFNTLQNVLANVKLILKCKQNKVHAFVLERDILICNILHLSTHGC